MHVCVWLLFVHVVFVLDVQTNRVSINYMNEMIASGAELVSMTVSLASITTVHCCNFFQSLLDRVLNFLYAGFSFLDASNTPMDSSNSDIAARLAKLEHQFGKVCNELVEVKHCLQKEVKSQVILENCLQEFMNKVAPGGSPATPY